RLAVFVKYEFWYRFINELKNREIPAILISGIFRKEQLFFKWYGKPLASMLDSFQRLFLQDQTSLQLLESIHVTHAEVAGDTRFDRVWQIARQPLQIPLIASFRNGKKLFVAGSTWTE